MYGQIVMKEAVGMKIESGGGRIQSPSQPSLRWGDG